MDHGSRGPLHLEEVVKESHRHGPVDEASCSWLLLHCLDGHHANAHQWHHVPKQKVSEQHDTCDPADPHLRAY